jgi:hypothetical protein
MMLLTWYDQAYLHRATSIAVLDAYLPHGNLHKFAAAVGVSPQWFTYFRQADSFSMPSLELARRIVGQLPAPPTYCQAFYEHLAEARKAYLAAQDAVQRRSAVGAPIHEYLAECNAAFYAATFGGNLDQTQQHYLRALALARTIVTQSAPEVYPLEYMEVCGTLLHICIALDRVAEGLYWIKVGNHLTQQLTTAELPTQAARERLLHLRYILARDEALGYHHLGDDKAALVCYDRAAYHLAHHYNPRAKQGDLARNRLLSLPGTARFTLSDAESLARQAKPVFEQQSDWLGLLLNQQALACAYMAYGNAKNLKRADHLLDGLLIKLTALPNAGQVHRAVVLQAQAGLYWRRGDTASWQVVMQQVWPIVRQAGLVYYANRLVNQYGETLNALLSSFTEEH